MSIIYPGTGRTGDSGTGSRTPPKPPSSQIGSNPGLITSTGGLNGVNGLLLTPTFNNITGNNVIIFHDPTNFNCEDDAEYDYRQEANYGQIPGEGRTATFHLIILKYRELGFAKFKVNITVFSQDLDDFQTISIPVSIPAKPLKGSRLKTFPDRRIHTQKITPPKGVFQGERPQVTITVKGNSGPVSITKLILCGNADETAQQ